MDKNSLATTLLGLFCLTFLATPAQAILAQCKNASIQAQYPYFSLLPVYLGRALVQNESTHHFRTEGNCFGNISIQATFTVVPYLLNDNVTDTIHADLAITLAEPYSTLCMEHFVVGTPFQDVYDFYFSSGMKQLTMDFAEPHHMVDVLTNGLRFFSFCADHTSGFSSLL
jgi:hypothetical protein